VLYLKEHTCISVSVTFSFLQRCRLHWKCTSRIF